MTNICIIGTGYVGLPSGVGFAHLGHDVICIDKDVEKIKQLQNGKTTLYEEGLDELLQENIANGRLKFDTDLKKAVHEALVIIIAVGTPTIEGGSKADLRYIYEVAEELRDILAEENIDDDIHRVIAIKSTVPVGTGDEVEKIINNKNVDVISLPEFLREGYAVNDFFNPDRIICGTESEYARYVITSIYSSSPMSRYFKYSNILYTKRRSAELIKYASNSFLAIKIHFINEIADLCEETDAVIDEVASGMGLDSRIGNKFLRAGIGFGGSCFPKDILALSSLAKDNNINLSLVESTIQGNNDRIENMAYRIMSYIPVPERQTISIFGLAFKNDTDDCRKSPAIEIVKQFINNRYKLRVYDKKALENAKKILGDCNIEYFEDKYSCVQNTEVCIILTEWEEFKGYENNSNDDKLERTNWTRVFELMKGENKMLFDYRNILNGDKMRDIGFEYFSIGNHNR